MSWVTLRYYRESVAMDLNYLLMVWADYIHINEIRARELVVYSDFATAEAALAK